MRGMGSCWRYIEMEAERFGWLATLATEDELLFAGAEGFVAR
jgi:hypothetical protein